MWEGDALRPAAPAWAALSSLAGLDEVALRAMCRRRRFARGEVVFHEGDPAGAIHLLDVGRVAVRLTTPLGDVATIDVLQRGDTFGEQALVDPTSARSATVTALERTETLALDVASSVRLREQHPGIDRFLLLVLDSRLKATSQQLLEALYLPAETRVFRCLCRLATMFVTVTQSAIPIGQADIGAMAGVTRSTVSRMLRQAQTDGVLTVSRSKIEIHDLNALRHCAQLRAPAWADTTIGDD
jgi:CRP/FNR family transcriptional regulator, cyclic AMP receptor protein